ncbi:VOC family protein [Cryptosporangium sp. NPDC048952]|uniref:VOC family protein n=1 Tax=Cryptosporangium sp. NPDC048952 TaxID=3363961 RepID=UPI00371C7DAF
MVSSFAQWTLDVRDVDLMAQFWSQALGYRIDKGDDGSAKLYPPAGAPPSTPTVWLQASGEAKAGKNRFHPDLVTVGDVDDEVVRLEGLGARRIDVGQTGEEPFVVLADPEDNEFCVLRR